jgi:hypothetical protein
MIARQQKILRNEMLVHGPDDNGDGNGAGAEYKKQRLAALMDGEHAVPVLKALAAAESLKAPQQVH